MILSPLSSSNSQWAVALIYKNKRKRKFIKKSRYWLPSFQNGAQSNATPLDGTAKTTVASNPLVLKRGYTPPGGVYAPWWGIRPHGGVYAPWWGIRPLVGYTPHWLKYVLVGKGERWGGRGLRWLEHRLPAGILRWSTCHSLRAIYRATGLQLRWIFPSTWKQYRPNQSLLYKNK